MDCQTFQMGAMLFVIDCLFVGVYRISFVQFALGVCVQDGIVVGYVGDGE
jgi:hypothetical protein